MRTAAICLAALAVFGGATPAAAAVTIASEAFAIGLPAGAHRAVTFDAAPPAGITLSGGLLKTGSDGRGAAPGIGGGRREASTYLAVNPGETATLVSTTGARAVSFMWGSIDRYNTVELLDRQGGVIGTFTGGDIAADPDGDQLGGATNRRVTFTAGGDTSAIYGLRLSSGSPAFEIDDVAFLAAVPEPATWATMIAGVGGAGAALRRRPKGRGRRAVA